MSKGKLLSGASSKSSLSVKEKAFDPTLASLFASSAGPITVPERNVLKGRSRSSINEIKAQPIVEPESSSDQAEDLESVESSETEHGAREAEAPPRKRRKVRDNDGLEESYLRKLAEEDEREQAVRLRTKLTETAISAEQLSTEETSSSGGESDAESDTTSSSASNDLLDLSDDEGPNSEGENDDQAASAAIPMHESLARSKASANQEQRTVFISNVSTTAIKSKSARKILLTHLKTALLSKENEKIESVRFRSTAFARDAGPKRAAFAKKELMDQTMRSTNAYVVLSSEAAARRTAAKLNGTVVLDRHIHVDSLAHPWRTDNKRCVFVGNLPFVDEETVEQNSDDEAEGSKKRKRPVAKAAADAEEGLWRAFSKCGKVESVRVVRDKATRVGKGFAYVQFEDGNGVEKALLYDGKKFPPLLPRILRVTRSKVVKRKDVRARDSQGRDNRRGQHSGRATTNPNKTRMNGVVFEGYRASSSQGKDKIKVKSKSRGKKDGAKPTTRSSKRGAAFKATGGRKKRDSTG